MPQKHVTYSTNSLVIWNLKEPFDSVDLSSELFQNI